MSEVSKFWDQSSTGDGILAPYSEPTDVATVLNAIAGCFDKTTNYGGVFQNQLNALLVSGTASPVSVATGRAIVYGTWYENNTSAVSIAVPTPTNATRIDRLVLRKDWTQRTVRITRIAGNEGGSEPALVQTVGSQWDIPLAKVSITTGGVITLTDEREFAPTSIIITYPISAANGGTGLSTLTAHGVLVGEGTANVAVTSAGTAGQVLTSNGASADPTFQTISTFTMPSGAIVAYGAGTTDPSGWFLCDGRAVSRTTYAALFTAIGTTYGAGDGSTTFNIPDLRGRTIFGADNMGTTAGAASRFLASNTLGTATGEYTHVLSSTELPIHSHTVNDPGHSHTIARYTGAGTAGSAPNVQVVTATDGNVSSNSATTGITTNTTGGGTGHNTIPLTQICNWIVKQ